MADLDKEFDNEIDLDDAFESEEDFDVSAPLGVSGEVAPDDYMDIPEELDETGRLSAFVQHAAPSASLGLSDVIAGGAGAAGHAAGSLMDKGELPSLEELRDTYYEAKGHTGEMRERALEEQPAASIAGMVTGGFAAPLPGAGIAKMGKVGQTIAKALPSLKGADKISKAGKLAEKAKLAGHFGRYKKLKTLQATAATKLALKEGGKAGAISAGMMGESKLLEGDVDGFIDDTLTGGAMGAGLGYGLTKGTQLTSALVKKLPFIKSAVDSFRFGSRGVDLNEAEVNHNVNKAAARYIKEFNGRLNKLGLDKQKILDEIDDLGITINTRADLEDAKKVITGIESATERKRAQQFLDVLDDYLGDGKAYKKIKDQLEKKIVKSRYSSPIDEARVKQQKLDLKKAIETQDAPIFSDDIGVVSSKDVLPDGGPNVKAQVKHNIMEKQTPDGIVQEHQFRASDVTEFRPSNIKRTVDPETGRDVAMFKDFGKGKIHAVVGEESRALDAEKLTTDQANRLKKLMNEYSALAKKENMPADVKRAATDAAKMINSKIEGAAEKMGSSIKETNRQMSNLMGVKERIGLNTGVTQVDKDTARKAMAKFVAGIGDKNPLDDKALVIGHLRKVDPKLADEVSRELDDLRRQYELARPHGPSNTTNAIHALFGSLNGVWSKAWNVLGQATTAPMRMAKAGASSTKGFLSNKSLDIIEASPAQIQGVINKISEGANKAHKSFVGPLTKALKSNQRQKHAIMFGLYQQPEFRSMVDSISDDEPTEE